MYIEWDMLLLNNCGLVMPYGVIYLDQHWLSWGLVAWWHLAITWTSVDLICVGSCGIHLKVITLEVFMKVITTVPI